MSSLASAPAKLNIPWHHPYWIELRYLFNVLNKHASEFCGVVLDVGCKDRPYECIAHAQDSRYIGLDLRFASDHGPYPDIIADAIALPIRSDSIDVFLCTQVLDDLPDPRGLVREAFRVLKPGGCVLLTAPKAWPIHGEPHDYWRFTRPGLTQMFSTEGFVQVAVEPLGGFWATSGQLFSAHLHEKADRWPSWVRGVSAMTGIFQRLCLVLDRLDFDPRYALDYFVYARVPRNEG